MNPRKSLHDRVEPRSPAERLLEATLPLAGSHRDGDLAAFRRRLREDPSAATADVWVASATGELGAARAFLARDPSLARTPGGTRAWEPLLYLCFSQVLRLDRERAADMREIARLLLDAGADPNVYWLDRDEGPDSRETPLYGAAGIANDVELARLLIERGADPNDGETAYHMVEHAGVPCAEVVFPRLEPRWRGCALGHQLDYDDLPGLRELLRLGADPNGPTPFPLWPIHQAVFRSRRREFFELLLAHGADVDKRNGFGRTAYAMAARSARREIMSWLAAAGADTRLEPRDAYIGASAAGDVAGARRIAAANPALAGQLDARDRSEIHEAAAAGSADGVRTMLDLGWEVNERGCIWGETPAHRAAVEGRLATFELLVDRGADLTLRDRSYHATPLGWARHGGHDAVVAAIRSRPERLDLWDAIELDLTERALELVSTVDPDAALGGSKPGVLLRLAVVRGNESVVRALVARGADPSLPNEQARSALDLARERGHAGIVAALELNGAGGTGTA